MELETDLLIIGGGTAGCLAAVEAKEKDPALRVTILEKAHIERSGCLAGGMNAINAYLNEGESPESYVRWSRFFSMGLLREDLALSMAREINSAVKKVEKWGLPIPKDEKGNYSRRGRWGIHILGEAIKPILAKAVADAGVEVINRVVVTNLLVQDGRVAGAVGFGVRDGKFYAVKAKATIVATGGAAGLYKPNNDGNAHHKIWYSPFNTGAGYAMGIRAGAEMTSFEMRFNAIRIKDINAPIGTIAVGFKAPVINAKGEKFMQTRFAHIGGEAAPTPLRVHGPMEEARQGRGPCYIDTRGMSDEQVRKLKEDYLDEYPTLVLHLASNAIDPSKQPLEIYGTDPYIVGGHCNSGYWIQPDRSTTLPGLYAAGDVAGGVGSKFVGGCFAEGIIAARSAVEYIRKQKMPKVSERQLGLEEERTFAPMRRKQGVAPREMEARLQKVMDEYAGGVHQYYQLTEEKLRVALREVLALKAQAKELIARDAHELMLAHEVIDRLDVAEVLLHHLLFRRETRWPGYQDRLEHPRLDDENWLVHVNSRRSEKGEVEVFARKYEQLVPGDRYKP